ncbi:unnamed protein product [Brassica oleracea]
MLLSLDSFTKYRLSSFCCLHHFVSNTNCPHYLCETGLQKKVTETELADEITVVFNEYSHTSLYIIVGIACFLNCFYLIECKCGSCGAKKQSPCEWEQHTGCRAKKWKYSVKVKGTMLTLEK